MPPVLVVLIGSQILFTMNDLLARTYLPQYGFTPEAFMKPWFLLYLLFRILGSAGQLYIFSVTPLGKTAAMFAAASIIVSNLLGFLVLQEVLTVRGYIGVTLAVIAILILAVK
jgi:drug/metabolite transporter (DMT)-like permease